MQLFCIPSDCCFCNLFPSLNASLQGVRLAYPWGRARTLPRANAPQSVVHPPCCVQQGLPPRGGQPSISPRRLRAGSPGVASEELSEAELMKLPWMRGGKAPKTRRAALPEEPRCDWERYTLPYMEVGVPAQLL